VYALRDVEVVTVELLAGEVLEVAVVRDLRPSLCPRSGENKGRPCNPIAHVRLLTQVKASDYTSRGAGSRETPHAEVS
jgi:hypothetical protein